MVERQSRNKAWLKASFSSLIILLGISIVSPAVLPAQSQQSSSSAPVAALNEQQRTGKILFLQNCSFCHLPKNKNPKSTAPGTSLGLVLKDLFRGENPNSEQVVRTIILQGVPQKMPGFQYGLAPKEIDSIIAYLKTL